MASTKSDKTKAAERAADTGEDYTPQATARKLGQNSNGEPTIYPSDIESVTYQYGLTSAEAERFLLEGKHNQKAADAIKGERVVFRPHYEVVDASSSNPLSVADARRAEAEAADAKATPAESDKFSPEAGPYGPNAVYSEVEAPVDTDHTSPRDPKEVEEATK